jgi:hypothetical protein
MPNSAVEFSLADFPGYTEQAARERRIRSAACFGLNEIICGFEVKPLCAKHISYLTLIRSPFLCGFTAEQLCQPGDQRPGLVHDIYNFLWIVSPMYCEGSRARKHWWQRRTARDKFNEAFAPVINKPMVDVVKEILEYVEEAFIDAEEGKPGQKSFFADEVATACEMSKHHGFRLDFWSASCPAEKNPLLIPLKIVFQLRKVRQAMEHGTDGLENRSDKLIAAALPKLGERFRQNQN